MSVSTESDEEALPPQTEAMPIPESTLAACRVLLMETFHFMKACNDTERKKSAPKDDAWRCVSPATGRGKPRGHVDVVSRKDAILLWRKMQHRFCPVALRNDVALFDTLDAVEPRSPHTDAPLPFLTEDDFLDVGMAFVVTWGSFKSIQCEHTPEALRLVTLEYLEEKSRPVVKPGASRVASPEPMSVRRRRKFGVTQPTSKYYTPEDDEHVLQMQKQYPKLMKPLLDHSVGSQQQADALEDAMDATVQSTVDMVQEEVHTAMSSSHEVSIKNKRTNAATLRSAPHVKCDEETSPAKHKTMVLAKDTYTKNWERGRQQCVEEYAEDLNTLLERFDEGRVIANHETKKRIEEAQTRPQPVKTALASIASAKVEQLKYASRMAKHIRKVGKDAALMQNHGSQQWLHERLIPNDEQSEGRQERHDVMVFAEQQRIRQLHDKVKHSKDNKGFTVGADGIPPPRASSVDLNKANEQHVSDVLQGEKLRKAGIPRPSTCLGGSLARPLSPTVSRGSYKNIASKVRVAPCKERAKENGRIAVSAEKQMERLAGSRYPDKNGNAPQAKYVRTQRKRLGIHFALATTEEARLRDLNVCRPTSLEVVGGTRCPLPLTDPNPPLTPATDNEEVLQIMENMVTYHRPTSPPRPSSRSSATQPRRLGLRSDSITPEQVAQDAEQFIQHTWRSPSISS